MAFPKGHKQGAGRPPGAPNKATRDARVAIKDFVEGNIDRLTGWLDQIAEENPKAAFDCFMSVTEYFVPKLARTESKVEVDATVEHKIPDSSQAILQRYMEQNRDT